MKIFYEFVVQLLQLFWRQIFLNVVKYEKRVLFLELIQELQEVKFLILDWFGEATEVLRLKVFVVFASL
jgi:hypothetical protein